jgi:hypothetical protein
VPQIFTPNDEYSGFGPVTIYGVPAEEKTITENGEYDAPIPTTDNPNGTYYNKVIVNVPNPYEIQTKEAMDSLLSGNGAIG